MPALGPIDYAIIGFPGNQFNGEIAPAIADLIEQGTVRIIDLVFMKKDADGAVSIMELNEVDEAVSTPFNQLVSAVDDLLTEDDIDAAAEALEPASSALLIVWENTWATRLAEAIRGAQGVMLAYDRIPHVEVQRVLAEKAG